MKYTINDEKGNMICSIENVDPTKSTEKFEEISITSQEQEKLNYNEKYKNLKIAENTIIKNEKKLLDKINSIKIPDSDLLNGSKYNQRTKNCKYELKINKSNINKFIWDESFKINKGKTTKYSYSEVMLISREYPIMVHFGSEDRDDKDQEQNYSIKIYGKENKYEEAAYIANGDFFKEYENKICNVLQNAIESALNLNDPNIKVKVKSYSRYNYKYNKIDKKYFSEPWRWFNNEYELSFAIILQAILTEDELNNTEIVSENGCDKTLKYLWDLYNAKRSILNDIKTKLPFSLDYNKYSKEKFISVFRPIINNYLKKNKNHKNINVKELIKTVSLDEELDSSNLYFKNDRYSIPENILSKLNDILRKYKNNFDITMDNSYRNEVILYIYPKNTSISV